MSEARAYVAVTAQGCEKLAMRALWTAGVAAFTPLERRWRYAAGRRRPHERPLPGFARLVFVTTRDIEADLPRVQACRYVEGVLGGVDGAATPIDAPVMGCKLGVGSSRVSSDWLLGYVLCQSYGLFDHTRGRKPKWTIGQLVKIIGGPFAGYRGAIAELRDGGRLVMIPKTGGRIVLGVDQLADDAPKAA